LIEYLVQLSFRLKSFGSFLGHVNAIKLGCCASVRKRLEASEHLRLFIRGLKRTLGSDRREKEALMPVHLLAIRETLQLDGRPSRRDVAFWAAILVGYYGMLRKANLVVPAGMPVSKRRDLHGGSVIVHDDTIEVRICASKSNQFSVRCHPIFLTSMSSAEGGQHPLCPVSALNRQLAVNSIISSSNSVHLFAVHEGSHVWRSLTPADFDRQLRSALEKANLQHLGFTGHSLRKGSATAAYRSGVSQVGIMRLGDWRSAAVTRYIRADHSDNLVTARQLAEGISSMAL
jgi:hypothetical protein